jgi:hypothetical protein
VPLVLIALGLGRAVGGEGEKPKPAKPAPKLHWHLPRQVAGGIGALQYGMMPYDVVRVAGRLCVSAVSGGNGQAFFYGRNPEGLWIELGGSSDARRISRWATLKDRAAVLVCGRKGLWVTVVAPNEAGEKKVQTFDFHVPEAPKDPMRSYYQYYNVYGADLAAHDGRLFAIYALQEYRSGSRQCQVLLRTSADGGKTWSKAHKLAEHGQSVSRGMSVAVWSGDQKLHVLYPPVPDRRKPQPGPLKHSISEDGGKTWKDGPALPPLPGNKSVQAARVLTRGREVHMLVNETTSSGRVSLYRSSDGGMKWRKPVEVGSFKTFSHMPGLDSCHLEVGKDLLVFGHGYIRSSHSYDRKTGRTRYNFSAGGGLLVSRDDGRSWKKQAFTRGLKGKAFCPRASSRADGGLDLVFGWTDGGSGGMTLLARQALPKPPPEADPAVKKAMAKLVKDLAAADYRERERAAAGLRRFGMAVLPELRVAAKDRDAERSLMAEELLRQLTPPWWKGP